MAAPTGKPREIQRISGQGLRVVWQNGVETELSSRVLRTNCPCAACREERGDSSHQKPLGGKQSVLRIIESTVETELDLLEVLPVGNYAVSLKWGDGHHTGIYDWDLLRELVTSHQGAGVRS